MLERKTHGSDELVIVIIVVMVVMIVVRRGQGIIVGSLYRQYLVGTRTRGQSTTHKESDLDILVIEDLLCVTLELGQSAELKGIQRRGGTYFDELSELRERMRISFQLLPDRPLLSCLSTVMEFRLEVRFEFLDNLLSSGPRPRTERSDTIDKRRLNRGPLRE